MKEFNKQNLPQVRQDLNKILKEYADKTGLTISIGNIKFSAGEFNAKLNVKIVGAVTCDDTMLNHAMVRHSLGKLGVGMRELTGYNSKAHAYPFIYSQFGKSYKCTLESAKAYFGTPL